jgi:hypothetical protein
MIPQEYYSWVYIDFSEKIPLLTIEPDITRNSLEFFSNRYNKITKHVLRYNFRSEYYQLSTKILLKILGEVP